MHHPSDLINKRLGSVASQTDYGALGDSGAEMRIPALEDLNYN